MITEDFELEFHGDHFRIKAGLDNKIDFNNIELWETLGDVCRRHNCRRVLSEGEIFPDGMTYTDAYFVTRLIAENMPAIKIACFVIGHLSKDLIEFVELTASNRGVSIGFFSDRKEAIDWLNGSRNAYSR